MIRFLHLTTVNTQKATEGLKKTVETVSNSTIFKDIIHLLDVLIWPIAMIIALYMFKDQISRIIKSLGSIKATTNGFELNFIEEKLEEAKKYIGIGASDIIESKGADKIIPKDGGRIIPKSDTKIIPKGADNTVPETENVEPPKRSHAASPYQELIELEDAIREKLSNFASENGLSVKSTSNFALTNDLADHNLINSHTAHKLKMLVELNTMGLNSPQTSHNQVKQMKKLYNNITF